AFARVAGLRIDHLLLSPSLAGPRDLIRTILNSRTDKIAGRDPRSESHLLQRSAHPRTGGRELITRIECRCRLPSGDCQDITPAGYPTAHKEGVLMNVRPIGAAR